VKVAKNVSFIGSHLSSKTTQMRSSCFCQITQRPVAGSYRSFGIAYWQLNNTLRCVTTQKSKGSSSTAENINTLEKQLYRVTTKVFKQHNNYFSHLVFHLHKPTTVAVRVFCYHLQIIIIFLPGKKAIYSSELSALFAALQQSTYHNNVSICYDGCKDFTVMVSAGNRENIKRKKRKSTGLSVLLCN
jgi:hypothetical protein